MLGLLLKNFLYILVYCFSLNFGCTEWKESYNRCCVLLILIKTHVVECNVYKYKFRGITTIPHRFNVYGLHTGKEP